MTPPPDTSSLLDKILISGKLKTGLALDSDFRLFPKVAVSKQCPEDAFVSFDLK